MLNPAFGNQHTNCLVYKNLPLCYLLLCAIISVKAVVFVRPVGVARAMAPLFGGEKCRFSHCSLVPLHYPLCVRPEGSVSTSVTQEQIPARQLVGLYPPPRRGLGESLSPHGED